MATDMKMTGIRLPEEQHIKIRYIAQKHHRKLADEFRLIVEEYIKKYEAENGEIEVK